MLSNQRNRLFAITLLILIAGPMAALRSVRADDVFESQIVPIFSQRCLSCHSGDEPKGDFSLQTSGQFFAAGYVEPGDATASHLVDLITPVDGQAAMPHKAEPLSETELTAVRSWIDAGAVWPEGYQLQATLVDDFDWWSYQPLKRPAIPEVNSGSGADRPGNVIDGFVRSKLTEQGLTCSPPADRRTLIRRLTYDLIGLPPSPEDVEAFASASDPQAYDKLVDRLLESQHYGEHWARHWLDVAKYADSCGYDKDKLRPNAWPYRDYVIRALNQDKPYDRFVQEQIAGDVLFPDDPDGVVALGFIAAGPWDFIGHVEVSESKLDGMVARNLDRDDMVAGALNTFCSLTVQCARCHNHKFDPITQDQYYGLQAIFAAVDRSERPYDIDASVAAQRRELLAKRDALLAEQPVAETSGEASTAADDTPQSGSVDHVTEHGSASAELTEVDRALAALPAQLVVYAATTQFAPQGNFMPTKGKPRAVTTLIRGEVGLPGDLAVPGVLPFTSDSHWQFDAQATEAERRSELAQWLTDRDHPLVWRSIVNRVWQYHFGQGIVATPNDFGRMGATPTHPELLDWLAVEFRDGGQFLQSQSLKSLHRLLVTSQTYQQSSSSSSAAAQANALIDGGNQFLWRAGRRRLTAEELRDSILTVSGAMDWQMGGPGYYLFQLEKPEHSPHFQYHKFDPADKASHRRSIYRFIARSQPNPYMTTLDCADSSQSTPRRNETLTSLQALTLLNNKFNLVMAQEFAGRLADETSDLESQVGQAVELVTQRPATRGEVAELVEYARTYGLNNLCRMLFNLSEFVFVD